MKDKPARRRGVAVVALAMAASAAAAHAQIDVLSVSFTGRTGNSASQGASTNVDGSVVAFYSDASNLLPGDSNGMRDVFVYDLRTATLERISVIDENRRVAGVDLADRASHANGGAPAISADGNVVAFYSEATNLAVDLDNNGVADVFVRVRDRGTGGLGGRTELISHGLDGAPANGPSLYPAISADGSLVAFQSLADNLVAGDTNGVADIFVYDRTTGTTERVCNRQPNRSSSLPSISPDGDFVAFSSSADNLVPGDTNGAVDIFLCDRRSGEIRRVSIGDVGQQANGDSIVPDVSAGGCVVTFKSIADNLIPGDLNQHVDVFARDLGRSRTEIISRGYENASANDASFPPSVSWDGRFVAFGSAASDLLIGDVNGLPSAYVRDRATGAIRLVDVNPRGVPANGAVPDAPVGISGSGDTLVFASTASNLDLGVLDVNATHDVFRTDNSTEPTVDGTICCDCGLEQCAEPSSGLCPTGCVAQCGSVCDVQAGECVPIDAPTPTATAIPSHTPTITPTAAASATASASATATRAATATATSTAVASATPTSIPSVTATTAVTPPSRTPTTPAATPSHSPTAGTGTATVTPPRGKRFDDDSCAIAGQRDGDDWRALALLLPVGLLALRRRRG